MLYSIFLLSALTFASLINLAASHTDSRPGVGPRPLRGHSTTGSQNPTIRRITPVKQTAGERALPSLVVNECRCRRGSGLVADPA